MRDDPRIGGPGAGAVTLTDNFQNGVQGDGSGSALVNMDNTLSGAGTVGGDQMGLANAAKGVIDATGTYNSLRLYGPGLRLANSGLIETTGAGGLDVAAVTLGQSGGGGVKVVAGPHTMISAMASLGGTSGAPLAASRDTAAGLVPALIAPRH